MGGTSVMIYGKVSNLDETQRTEKRSFFERLINRQRKGDQISDLGDYLLITHSSPNLRATVSKIFGEYIQERLVPIESRDRFILDYIQEGKFCCSDTYLRSEQRLDETVSYLQVHFSGSAGMSEVSAELAAHWFELGYSEEFREALDQVLRSNYSFEAERIDNIPRVFLAADYEEYSFYVLKDSKYGVEYDGWISEYGGFDQGALMLPNGEGSVCQCKLCNTSA